MLIPYIDFITDPTHELILRVMIIASMVIFFAQFCFSITNIIRYLILENRFFTAIPLTFFYCLVSVYQLYRVAYFFLLVGVVVLDNALGLIFTEFFSLSIGIA